MKIVITGSLGHISKPLATELIAKGHSVTVIRSKAEKHTEKRNCRTRERDQPLGIAILGNPIINQNFINLQNE